MKEIMAQEILLTQRQRDLEQESKQVMKRIVRRDDLSVE